MWKKAFVLLISIDLLVVVAAAVWFASLPSATHGTPPKSSSSSEQQAKIELSMGAPAINTYLAYALAKQPDVAKAVSYVRVDFGDQWLVDFGLRLGNRAVPVQLTIAPHIQGGNLGMQMQHATLGGISIPPALLVLTLAHAPWPSWITVDTSTNTLAVNFAKRPSTPYGLRVLSYSAKTKQLSVQVLITPQSVLSGHL